MGTIITSDPKELKELSKTIREIQLTVEFIRINMMIPATVSISDIARLLDISEKTLRERPYLLPNNGKSEFQTGKKRWYWQTFLDWMNVSEETHKKEFATITLNKFTQQQKKGKK